MYPKFEEAYTEDSERHCLECGSDLTGRFDQKFCSTRCKNRYHNEHSVRVKRYHEKVQRCLKTNYGILDKLCRMGVNNFPREDLAALGFRSEFCTSSRIVKGGITEHSCYEYRYRLSEARMFSLKKVDLEF